MFTTAETRALAQLTSSTGRLAIVAADQRQSLRKTRERHGLSTSIDDLRDLKRDIVSALAPAASGVLLDPEIALPTLVDDATVPRDAGLLVAVERSGTTEEAGLRVTETIIEPLDVRRLGGTAAKLLVYVRPDLEDADGSNGQLVAQVAEACAATHLLLIVEVLTYPLAEEAPESYARRKPDLIREAAVLVAACGAKMLKLESPGDARACTTLTHALAVPWAVLSAGVDHETFCGILQDALAGGASGFIAGRSLWKEAVLLEPAERRAFLEGEGRRRLAELLELSA